MRAVTLLSTASLVTAQVPRPKLDPIDIDKEFPKIPNEYIVVFHPDASDDEIFAHHRDLAATDGTLKFKYNISTDFRGYSVRVQDAAGSAVQYIQKKTGKAYAPGQEVHYMEQNGVAKASEPPKDVKRNCNTQEQTTWGLVRVGQEKLDIDGLFSYTTPPTDAHAYILDTGIYRENVEFDNRAVFGADFTTNSPPETDLNGHGTHCAGTVAGNLHGMVKNGKVVDVRVLDAYGSGSFDGVIAGVDWAANDAKGSRAVGSMSLGGGYYAAVNQAVNAASDTGLTMVVAAGNNAMDSCSFSPASAENAITVMCSDSTDAMCYFSNYGSCSDIIAPGMAVTSAWIGSPYSENTISGTSMSAPHVAGAALRILAEASYPMSPAEVKAELVKSGADGVITEVMGGSSTPNVLLQQICTGPPADEPITV